jgi:predicted phosphodiesterase
MIKAQGADMVLHVGDFDYTNNPDAWDTMISDVLGRDFPLVAVVGNHDVKQWSGPHGYQAKLAARVTRIAGAQCTGDLGVMSACTYRGLFFILSGAGTIPKGRDDPNHVAYIKEQLARTEATWRICSWHKVQAAMQVGTKKDEVGWGPYEACREGGAIVATGHEHSYSRTHLMASFASQRVTSTSRTLVIEPGKSFAFVSGMGGMSIRDQARSGAWWASIYTRSQGADYGALLCTFNVKGDPARAECHFRDIRGRVADRFELVSAVNGATGAGAGR